MRRTRQRSRGAGMALAPIMAASLALALSACGSSSAKSPPTTGPVATVTSVPKTTTTVPAQVSTSLYFVRGTTLGVAVRTANSSADPRYLAVQALLAGPVPSESAAGLGTAIPAGTAVRGLQIRGGVATINLSPEFVMPGPAPSLAARLAQIVYTLTAYSNVRKVAFEVSKAPLPAFAGVSLAAPVGRSQITAALPDVLLETPAVGSSLHGTLPLSGLTSFTGTFDVQLVDATGRLLAAVTNTAVVGATFAQTLPFSIAKPGTGKLRVFAKPSTPGQPPEAVTFTLPISP